jgi:hypothetical protein
MLCARFVPHSTPEQRKDRFTSYQEIIVMADAQKFSLTRPGVLPVTSNKAAEF